LAVQLEGKPRSYRITHGFVILGIVCCGIDEILDRNNGDGYILQWIDLVVVRDQVVDPGAVRGRKNRIVGERRDRDRGSRRALLLGVDISAIPGGRIRGGGEQKLAAGIVGDESDREAESTGTSFTF
jgi:hypothetical protein